MSQGRFLFVPDTVLPKMFMFIGFFLSRELGEFSPPHKLFRVFETVVLANGRFVPCRKQVVLTKVGGNADIAFYPQKQGTLLLKPRKSTTTTKMADVTPTK